MSDMPSTPHRPVERRRTGETVVSIQTDSPMAPAVEVSPERNAGGPADGAASPSTPQIIITGDLISDDSPEQDPDQQRHHHHHHHHLPNPGAGQSITILTPPTSASASRINIHINNHFANPMARRPLHPSFELNEDVLMRHKHDHRYYLGSIQAIAEHQCLVRFDDGTKDWAYFDDIKKVEAGGSDGATDRFRKPRATCVVCKEDRPHRVVEVCETCRRGYHPRCDDGQPSEQNNEENRSSPQPGPWYCRRCTVGGTTPPPSGSGMANGSPGTGLPNEHDPLTAPLTDADQLPYDLDGLVWDAPHEVNESGQYCYCGEDGDWNKEMVQCWWCRQWFHGRCIRSLQYPIYLGDRFYLMLCSICNGGHEFVRRLEITYGDLLQLVLFNLIMRNGQRLFSLQKAIIPYVEDNLRTLQAPDHITHATPTARAEALETALRRDRELFLNGKELNKSGTLWTLRVCQAPRATVIDIPRGQTVTENLLKQVAPLKLFLPRICLERNLVTDAATRERMTGIKYNVPPFSEADPRQAPSVATHGVAGPSTENQAADGQVIPKRRGRPPRAVNGVPASGAGAVIPGGSDSYHSTNKRKTRSRSCSTWKSTLAAAGDVVMTPCLIDEIFPPPPDLLTRNNPFRHEVDQAAEPRPRPVLIHKRRVSASEVYNRTSGRGIKKRKLNNGAVTAVKAIPPAAAAKPNASSNPQEPGPSGLQATVTSASSSSTNKRTRPLRPRQPTNYSDTRRYRPRKVGRGESEYVNKTIDTERASSSMSSADSLQSLFSTNGSNTINISGIGDQSDEWSDNITVKMESVPDDDEDDDEFALLDAILRDVQEEIARCSDSDETAEEPRNYINCVRNFPDGHQERQWL